MGKNRTGYIHPRLKLLPPPPPPSLLLRVLSIGVFCISFVISYPALPVSFFVQSRLCMHTHARSNLNRNHMEILFT